MIAQRLVKFPRTPHLFWLGADSPRRDKVLAPADAEGLLARPASAEEKLDGACIGFSVDAKGDLRDALGSRLILYGEWCYARHTAGYDALPDWFLAFDVYDRQTRRFWSRDRRDAFAPGLGLATVPLIAAGRFKRLQLETLVGRSLFGSGPMEGLYFRWDEGPWLIARAKLVRRGWVMAGDTHWKRRPLETNRLAETRIAARS